MSFTVTHIYDYIIYYFKYRVGEIRPSYLKLYDTNRYSLNTGNNVHNHLHILKTSQQIDYHWYNEPWIINNT